ncbi:MAG: hypothetical protein ACRDOK_20550 [Streptosporangiaceae bacterium]
MTEISVASDWLQVAVRTPAYDAVGVRTDFRVDRWDEEQTRWANRKIIAPPGWQPQKQHFERLGVKPYSTTIEENCNLVVQNGWIALLGGIAGTTIAAKFSATNGRIGVGTSSTAASYSQTYLQGDTGSGSATSYYSLCGAGPTISTGSSPPTLVFVATFGPALANFTWAEFGTDNANASGVYLNGLAGGFVLLNRGVSAQGSKTAGQTWTATETISFGYPSGSGTVV